MGKQLDTCNLVRSQVTDQSIAYTKDLMFEYGPEKTIEAFKFLEEIHKQLNENKDVENHIKVLVYNWASIGFNITFSEVANKVNEHFENEGEKE